MFARFSERRIGKAAPLRRWAAIIGFLSILSGAFAAALTPEQVIALKQGGVSEEIIALMIGEEASGPREIIRSDGTSVIFYSNEDAFSSSSKDRKQREELDRAWRILENIVIDAR
ncbi:MAG: hypothetical protein JW884_07100 [Deltaproteobacteria bacterium]|nr:hypothetical protein [Deltaproteobacteria bacterium]